MSYSLESRVDELLISALKETDISNEISELQIPNQVLKTEILENSEQVTQSMSGLIEDYNLLDSEVRKASPYRLRNYRRPLVFAVFSLFVFLVQQRLPIDIFFTQPVSDFYQPVFNLIFSSIALTLSVILVIRFIRMSRSYRELEFNLGAFAQSIDAEVLENGIKPFLRLYVNNQKSTSFDTSLDNKDAPGLWTIMDTIFEVPTVTKMKAERLISSLSGGSIGIAGPRGVGKSTMLLGICNPDNKIFQGSPVLTVLTSVPVKYDAKDFVLHLYSQLCQKVIQLELASNPRIAINASKFAQANILTGFRNLLSSFWQIIISLFFISSIGIIFSIALASSNSLLGELITYLDRLDISIGDIFKVSALFFGISLFFLSLLLTSSLRSFQFRFITRRSKEDALSELLVLEAERRLVEINYQLSFSEGWSGGIKLPEMIQFAESSSEYSITKTKYQLTLPEIISDYRQFVRDVSKKYKILIGIDELDKISSSETAQQFLNETKAIFGLRNCFYLVSISDNALSNFERRGIAFRDEFDTSFDEVLFLETPDIEYDLALLRRRVIGLPLPFVYYCYTQSGGLPRDLIRVCREVFDIAGSIKKASLKKIVAESVSLDLRSKIRAISIAATENLIEPEASTLFSALGRIDLSNPSPSFWINISSEILKEMEEFGKEILPIERVNMRKLIEELATYLQFSATIMQYFSRMGKNKRIKPLSKKRLNNIENLAHAQQLITSSPSYSRNVISNFRHAENLDRIST